MSTKIYNAYKFKGDNIQLMNFLKRAKKVWHSHTLIILRNNADCFVGPSIIALDPWLTYVAKDFKEKEGREPQLKDFGSDIVRILECYARRGYNEPLNVHASIAVYFHKKEGCLLQIFGIPEIESKFLKDFHYQDQTDKPKRITDKEWENRKCVWDDIFSDTSCPDSAGLIYKMNTKDSLFELTKEFI